MSLQSIQATVTAADYRYVINRYLETRNMDPGHAEAESDKAC